MACMYTGSMDVGAGTSRSPRFTGIDTSRNRPMSQGPIRERADLTAHFSAVPQENALSTTSPMMR